MWECPICKRTFEKVNQSHYCVKPNNIDEYILQQPQELQSICKEMRTIIQQAIPQTTEKISWSMPTFWDKRNIIQFACFKKHIGLYPGPIAIEIFSEELKDYKTSKGTIQLPHSKPLPQQLISDIAKWCYENSKKGE